MSFMVFLPTNLMVVFMPFYAFVGVFTNKLDSSSLVKTPTRAAK
jgi:hypothetical protein